MTDTLFDRSTCHCRLDGDAPARCPDCNGVGTVPTCPCCGSDLLELRDGEPVACMSCDYPDTDGDRADALAAREDR